MIRYLFPLRLPYPGASTVEDSAGRTIAECPDMDTAAWLVDTLNAAADWWTADVIRDEALDDEGAQVAYIAAVSTLILALDRGMEATPS